MIEINVTFVIQLINFIVALIIVNYALISPVRAIIHKRKASRYDLIRRTHAFTTQTDADVEEYEKTLRAAREEGGALRQKLRDEGVALQTQALAKANVDAAAYLHKERGNTALEADNARKALAEQVKVLADEVAGKLLA